MPDYQKGKIYQIWDENFQECYIGSTVQELSMRMCGHRKDYRRYKEGINSYMSVFTLFDKYGVSNCRVELVEDCSCNSKHELERREGEIIRTTDCINKNVAGRTSKERYEDDREKYLQKFKDCGERNKERRQLYHKYYRDKNKDKIKEQKRENYENQRETILIKMKQPWTCQCGLTTTVSQKYKHLKSPKHQNYINQTSQQTSENSS